ncbi:MAG: hypothetical protein ABI323_14110, partial [Solirubrobacteraceae bacterium]
RIEKVLVVNDAFQLRGQGALTRLVVDPPTGTAVLFVREREESGHIQEAEESGVILRVPNPI